LEYWKNNVAVLTAWRLLYTAAPCLAMHTYCQYYLNVEDSTILITEYSNRILHTQI